MILNVVIFFAALACGFAADEAPPAPEAILDKYFEVTGGKARYEKLVTQISSGGFIIGGQGIIGTITIYRAAPNLSHVVLDLGGTMGTIEEGSDGEVAWQKNPMTGWRLKEGREKDFALRASMFNGEINWRDQFDKVELAGIEKVQDHDCYKIVMRGKNANDQTRYYDKKTNLVTKIAMTAITPGGEIATDTLMSDYREEGGILSPHKLVQSAAGQQLTITLEKVQYNSELPPGVFDLPMQVKELVKAPAGVH